MRSVTLLLARLGGALDETFLTLAFDGHARRIRLIRSKESPTSSVQGYGLSLWTPKRLLNIRMLSIPHSSLFGSGVSSSSLATNPVSPSKPRSTDPSNVYDVGMRSGSAENAFRNAPLRLSTFSPSMIEDNCPKCGQPLIDQFGLMTCSMLGTRHFARYSRFDPFQLEDDCDADD